MISEQRNDILIAKTTVTGVDKYQYRMAFIEPDLFLAFDFQQDSFCVESKENHDAHDERSTSKRKEMNSLPWKINNIQD